MSEQFRIRPALELLQAYGNSPPRLAEAANAKIITALEATLAVNELKRAQAAAQGAQNPQQTIAQQLFNTPPMGGIGMPASPAPQGTPAGLGATPEAAQMQAPMPEMPMPEMPAPEMAMPEMPQEEDAAPMGMAEGGLTTLPLPDTMFDEPNNGSYADGGIVALAGGGETDGQRFERIVTKYIPGTTVTSRQRSVERNKQVGGNPNSFHIPDRARDFVPPKGMSLTEFGAIVKSIPELKGTDAVFNSEGHFDHLHLEPGPGGKRSAAPTPREVDTNTFAGRGMSAEDSIALAQYRLGKLPREQLERAKAAALEELDPEKIEKDRKYDMYEALANFGFSLASPDDYRGEGILGSIAKAAKATMPGIAASKKERKAAKSEAVRNLMAYEDVDRKTAIAGVEIGMDAWKTGLTAEQQQRALSLQRDELDSRNTNAALDRDVQRLAILARQSNPTTFETQLAAYRKSYPGVEDVALFKQMKTDGLLGSNQAGMGMLPGDPGSTGEGNANSGMTILGSKPVQ